MFRFLCSVLFCISELYQIAASLSIGLLILSESFCESDLSVFGVPLCAGGILLSTLWVKSSSSSFHSVWHRVVPSGVVLYVLIISYQVMVVNRSFDYFVE
jgi:hypothetical protein